MSRRVRDEAITRVKRGKSHDKIPGNVSTVHVRSSANFLSPDASHSLTGFDQAPSLNRLQAQSSTETSGLGETVTSGFSSQESVPSCHVDEKDSVGLWDRSLRKGGSTPGCVVRLREFLDTSRGEGCVHVEDSKRISKGFPNEVRWLGSVTSVQDTDKNVSRTFNNNSGIRDNVHTPFSYSPKPFRDTGGRSLTPQQAKDEWEKRQRRLEQSSRDRGSAAGNGIHIAHVQQPGRLLAPHSVGQPSRAECVYRQNKSADERQLNVQERWAIDSSHTTYTVGDSCCDNQISASNVQCKANQDYTGVDCDRTRVTFGNSRTISSVGDNARGILSSRQCAEVLKRTRPAHGREEDCSTSDCVYDSNRIVLDVGSRHGENKHCADQKDLISSASGNTKGNSSAWRGPKNSLESLNYKKQAFEVKFKTEPSSCNLRHQFIENQFIKPIEASNISTGEITLEARNSIVSGVVGSDVKFCEPLYVHGKSSNGSRKRRTVDRNKECELNSVQSTCGIKEERNGTDQVLEGVIRSCRGLKGITVELRDDVKDPWVHQRNRPAIVHGDNFVGKCSKSSLDPRQNEQGRNSEATSTRFHDINIRARETAENNTPVGILRTKDSSSAASYIDGRTSNDNTFNKSDVKNASNIKVRRTDYKHESIVSSKSLSGPVQILPDNACAVFVHDKLRLPDKSFDKEKATSDYDRGFLQRVSRTIGFSVYNSENVRALRDKITERMDYDRLFQRASRGLNGSGGGGGGDSRGNRGYQAVNNDDYSPTRQSADGFAGFNFHGRNHVQQPRVSLGGTTVSFANSQQSPVVQVTSVPHATFQMPLSTVGPVPTVQLITSPDVPGLNLATIDTEWERRGSRCSNRSHNSKGSGKASNRFLGVNTGSAWTRWSRERRASYRRRIEKLTQEEPVPAPTTVVRISTPIKKARQEGLKFMHPDLEGRYLSEDDINELRRHKQQQVHVMRVIERNRKNKYRRATEVKLSTEQWHMLQEFWDHALFIRARYMGVLASMVAFIFMIVSISSHSWVKHSTWNLTIVEGLWLNCTQPTVIPNASEGCIPSNGRSMYYLFVSQ